MNDVRPMDKGDDAADLRAEIQRLAEALALAEHDHQLLGFEIHDGLVQDMTAAVMLLEGAAHDATFASDEASGNFSGALRLLREGIAEARRLIAGTAAVEIDPGGLAAGLQRLVEKFSNGYGLPLTFFCDCSDLVLPPSVQHLLLRIAHEALSNVWKHAHATETHVRLTRCDGKLELCIADDGIGYEPGIAAPGHFGLESIRARSRVLSADVLFDTAPNHGTRIIVRLPLPF
jgi:signal transduction histidine kinase